MEQTTQYKKLIDGPAIKSHVPSTQIEYIGSAEASRMLGISKPTLIKEAVEGYINAHLRRGRYLFTKEDIQEYILRNMTCRTTAIRKLSL